MKSFVSKSYIQQRDFGLCSKYYQNTFYIIHTILRIAIRGLHFVALSAVFQDPKHIAKNLSSSSFIITVTSRERIPCLKNITKERTKLTKISLKSKLLRSQLVAFKIFLSHESAPFHLSCSVKLWIVSCNKPRNQGYRVILVNGTYIYITVFYLSLTSQKWLQVSDSQNWLRTQKCVTRNF